MDDLRPKPIPLFRSWKRIALQLIAILLAYVLSTGPMYWYIFEAYYLNGSTFIAKLYYPLVILCQLSDRINAFFDWYIGLWVY